MIKQIELRYFVFNFMKFPVEDNLSDCGCALLKPQLMTQSNSHWKTVSIFLGTLEPFITYMHPLQSRRPSVLYALWDINIITIYIFFSLSVIRQLCPG